MGAYFLLANYFPSICYSLLGEKYFTYTLIFSKFLLEFLGYVVEEYLIGFMTLTFWILP